MMHLGIAIIVTAIWMIAGYLPVRNERSALGAQIVQAEVQLTDFNLTIAQLPQIIAAREDLALKLQALNSKLYAKGDVLKLLDQLRHDASQYNLTVIEIVPSVSELLEINRRIPESGEPQFLNVSMRMNGDYLKFGQFVHFLEKAVYFRGITACQISRPAIQIDALSLTLGFKAQIGTSGEKS